VIAGRSPAAGYARVAPIDAGGWLNLLSVRFTASGLTGISTITRYTSKDLFDKTDRASGHERSVRITAQ
jgi:hypothetical protein